MLESDTERNPAGNKPPRRESLELKRVINLARGAPVKDWPPDDEWTYIFQDIKDAIDRGELAAAVRGMIAGKWSSVRLADLWPFIADRDDRWEPLRTFCRRWAETRGVALTDLKYGLSDPARQKGGSRRKYNAALQKFISATHDAFLEQGKSFSLAVLNDWLYENAPHDKPLEAGIPNCDEIYIEADRIGWTDDAGQKHDLAVKSLARYINRAKDPENHT